MTKIDTAGSTGDADERLPGWVPLAAISVMAGGGISVWGAFAPSGLTIGGILSLAYAFFLFATGIALLLLKKWGYWAFLAAATFTAMNVAADLLLTALDMPPSAEISIVQVVRLAVSIVWVAYFLSEPVRSAFEAKRLW